MTSGNALAIGAADDAVIRAVWRLHYLTAEQLTRLLYSERSITYARERLATLTHAAYLARRAMPRPSRTGSAPWVYSLGPRGKAYLESLDEQVERLRPATTETMGLLHLRHALAISDVLIAVERLCTTRADFRLGEALHEREIQARLATLPGLQGSRQVIPDAWLDLRQRLDGTTRRYGLALEIDRGSEHQTAWRRKIAALVPWSQGPAERLFGISATALTVAVVTTAGEPRCTELVRWTAAELTRLEAQQHGTLFRFVASAAGTQTAGSGQPLTAELFVAPVWRTPFQEQAVTLLGA